MKILSGDFRGRRIPFRVRPGLRPTPDKVRQAILDVLRPVLEDSSVIDLFCGTGSLGLEAISCGARSVLFVEHDRMLSLGLKKLIARWGLEHETRLVCGDVWKAIRRFYEEGDLFDIILADPPYQKRHSERLLNLIGRHAILRKGGWLVLETHKSEALNSSAGDLERLRHLRYGDTAVHFFRRKE